MAKYQVMSKIPPHVVFQAPADLPTSAYPRELKWSHLTMPVPALDSIVHVRINQIGLARVTNYFTEDGFLGVIAQPIAPPEWYVKHNGRRTAGHFFGAEIDPAPEVAAEFRARVRIRKQLSQINSSAKLVNRFTAEVRNERHQLLLNGSEQRTTPELAMKLAEKFCAKNKLTIYNVEFPLP